MCARVCACECARVCAHECARVRAHVCGCACACTCVSVHVRECAAPVTTRRLMASTSNAGEEPRIRLRAGAPSRAPDVRLKVNTGLKRCGDGRGGDQLLTPLKPGSSRARLDRQRVRRQ